MTLSSGTDSSDFLWVFR